MGSLPSFTLEFDRRPIIHLPMCPRNGSLMTYVRLRDENFVLLIHHGLILRVLNLFTFFELLRITIALLWLLSKGLFEELCLRHLMKSLAYSLSTKVLFLTEVPHHIVVWALLGYDSEVVRLRCSF